MNVMTAGDLKATDLSALDSKALMKLEAEIAQRFMGGVPWGSVTWALTNLAVWLSLWPLTILGIVPIWVAFPIACLNVMLSYLPSHEAQHDIIARPGEPLRWLNQLVGTVSTIPLVGPYRVLKMTHMEHHKHCNHPFTSFLHRFCKSLAGHLSVTSVMFVVFCVVGSCVRHYPPNCLICVARGICLCVLCLFHCV
jgi:hypothetical protein